MGEDPFVTLAGPAEVEIRERGSSFLALAAPAGSEEAARGLLSVRARERWDATHHCSAWRLRDGTGRANDDGEPGGSAGAPILAAIDGAGVVDCLVVVTRYYGGTKLGVGGLVRAYGEAAAGALGAAPRRIGVPADRLRIAYPYERTALVMRLLDQFRAADIDHGYDAAGAQARVEFSLPRARVASFRDGLREGSAATLEPVPLRTLVLFRLPGDPLLDGL